MKKNMLYKFLMPGLKSMHGNQKWKIGKWYKISGGVVACTNGFHASRLVCDAIGYVATDVLSLVEARGESDIQKDKECWSEMRVVRAWKLTKADFVALAVCCAEMVIDIFEEFNPNDKRPRLAIEAANVWIKNPSSSAARAAGAASYAAGAASYAAGAASYAASYAAGAASYAARAAGAAGAASYAARAAGAAGYAARAAGAASYAAGDEIKSKIQKWIVRQLRKAKEIGVRRAA